MPSFEFNIARSVLSDHCQPPCHMIHIYIHIHISYATAQLSGYLKGFSGSIWVASFICIFLFPLIYFVFIFILYIYLYLLVWFYSTFIWYSILIGIFCRLRLFCMNIFIYYIGYYTYVYKPVDVGPLIEFVTAKSVLSDHCHPLHHMIHIHASTYTYII